MSRQSPIHTLLDLAQTRLDDATKRLGELISSEQASAVKFQLLQDYRVEYRNRFLQAARDGIDPSAWRNYSAFLQRLDEAIAQQQRAVELSHQQTMRGQQDWVAERNRMKAFDTLSKRQEREAMLRQDKAEQKSSDEHAIKQFLAGADDR